MNPSKHTGRIALIVALGVLCAWVFWPALQAMAHKWVTDPQYSHGYLVPAFSLALLVMRRDRLAGAEWGAFAWGLGLITLGAAGYAFGGFIYFDWLQAASLIPTLAGLLSMFGGRPALRWSWPALLFLLFMIPLPFRVEHALGFPLQRVATVGGTYVLQTVGLPAFAEGNVILLESGNIGVVEACSGLSMLLIFFALATGFVMVTRPPWIDTCVLLLSAAPIAIVVNIVRISATGMAQEWVSPEAAETIFHDWAGWLMMPVAVAILWLEAWLLRRMFPESEEVNPLEQAAVGLSRRGERFSRAGEPNPTDSTPMTNAVRGGP